MSEHDKDHESRVDKQDLLVDKKRPSNKVIWIATLATCLVVALAGAGVYLAFMKPAPKATKQPIVLKFMSGELAGDDTDVDLREIEDDFTKQTGIKIEDVYAPQSMTAFNDIGKFIYDNIKSDQPTMDVVIVDGTWASWFAKELLDLKPSMASELDQHFPDMVRAATFNNKTIAAPYFQDVPLLFYRKDLLQKYGYTSPPATWDELETMAKKIQAGERATDPEFWGLAWEGDESEALTTSVLEMQAAYGGGQTVENGKITVNNSRTAQGLLKAKGWIGTIAPESTLKATESEAIALWTSGHTAFMRNWTFAYGISANDSPVIKDKFDVTVLPAGSARRANTLGGEYLGVASRTKYPQEATQFVNYMTSRLVQKRRAIHGDIIPTRPDLYKDNEVIAAQPWYAKLEQALTDYSISRPALGDKYIEFVAAYATDMHAILSGKTDVSTGLKTLEADLSRITGLPVGAP